MKTEDIQRTPTCRDPHEVSRALQELTPLACAIVDRRGKAVPLSAAGYVVRYGHSYHLRVRSPFKDEELQEVRIVNPPPFVTVEPELRERDEEGRAVRSLPFKVSLDWWSLLSHMRRFGIGVNSDELEVVQHFKPGVFREAPPFLCPIVARPRWTVLIALAVVGMLVILLERLVTRFLAFDSPDQALQSWKALARWDLWLWFASITLLVWCAVSCVNLYLLHGRSRELRQHFRELYPPS